MNGALSRDCLSSGKAHLRPGLPRPALLSAAPGTHSRTFSLLGLVVLWDAGGKSQQGSKTSPTLKATQDYGNKNHVQRWMSQSVSN